MFFRPTLRISIRRWLLSNRPWGFSPIGRLKLGDRTFKNVAEPQSNTGEVAVTDEQVDEEAIEEVAVIDELEPEPAEKSGFG